MQTNIASSTRPNKKHESISLLILDLSCGGERSQPALSSHTPLPLPKKATQPFSKLFNN